MEGDLIKAVIAALRAAMAAVGSGPALTLAGRIYPAGQVPHDAPFPRGTVGYLSGNDEWMDAGGYRMRVIPIAVEWSVSNVESISAHADVLALDAITDDTIRAGITAANLTLIRRAHSLPPLPTVENDNVEYLTAGGVYTAWMEYHYV